MTIINTKLFKPVIYLLSLKQWFADRMQQYNRETLTFHSPLHVARYNMMAEPTYQDQLKTRNSCSQTMISDYII